MRRAGFLVIVGGMLLAQDPIRVNTRLVQVSVVVRDSHGPVLGLSKENFTVFDKGQARPVAVFVANSAAPKTPVNSAAPAAPSQAHADPLPPGVVTNKSDAAERPVSATVILIDALNTDFKDQQVARKQILKFVSSLDHTRRVAIYLLNTRIRVLQDFTDDPALLKAALEKYTAESSAALRGANEANPHVPPPSMTMNSDPSIDAMLESFNEMRDAHQVDRAKLTANALQQIAVHLARVSGRKTLIWMSSGFPFYLINDERGNFLAAGREERNFQDEINQAVRALSSADIAIYPVDARGLIGIPVWDVANPSDPVMTPITRRGRFGTRGNGQIGIAAVDMPDGLETMNDLAAGTGGRAFHNTNDLQSAVAAAIEDADTSYTIGFYATDPPDDSFHPIKVKVDRPGAEARYRTSYYSTLVKPPTESSRVSWLEAAVRSALDATGIGLTAQVERESASHAAFHLAVKIDVNDLSLNNENGKWAGGFDISFVAQDASGAAVNAVTKTITLDLSSEVYLARKRDGIVLEQTLAPNPAVARIRIAAIDHRSGVIGSLSLKP